jgi:NarL family two-component system response regulator LiaR
MQRGPSKKSLRVCFIEHNPLALGYLLSIVRKDSSIEVAPMEASPVRRDPESSAPIFIVDDCGLPLPLSECLRRLRPHYPNAKYLVLAAALPKEDLLRLLCLKIDGFVSYHDVPRFLLAAIHSMAGGRIWVPREVLREYVQCATEARRKDSPLADSMTARETEITELVKRRFSNKEIADILRIQESTVKFHLSNVYSKLRVGGRQGLVREQRGLNVLLPAFARSPFKA